MDLPRQATCGINTGLFRPTCTSADTPLLGPIAVNEGLSFVAGVRSGAGGGVLGQIAAQSPALQILLQPTGLEEGEESTGSRIYLPAVTR